MTPVTRRKFLGSALLTGGALTSTLVLPEALSEEPIFEPASHPGVAIADDPAQRLPSIFVIPPHFARRPTAFQMTPQKRDE